MNMIQRIVALAVLGLVLTGCAANYKSSSYQGGQVQQAMKVKLATVLEIRDVEIQAQNSGTGATVGAAIGGTAGAYSSNRSGVVSSIAGALLGGVVGNAAEKAINAKTGIEITYRLDGSNDIMALVQEKDESDPIQVGDRIKIVEGSTTRAVKLAANSGL